MTTHPRPGIALATQELASLRASIEALLPTYLADLERLVNIDCGTYTPAGVNQVATLVAGALAALDARVERQPDVTGRFGDVVVGTWQGRPGAGPRLLLIGHMDTVFEAGTAAARPFRIEDGVAYGPGVADMKSGLLTGLHALVALRRLAGDAGWAGLPFEQVIFVANPDEEVGSPFSTPFIQTGAAGSDACFVLECARANGDFVGSRKGMVDLRLVVHGRAAHAGVEPEKGRNAIAATSELVGRIHALNGRWQGVTVNVGVLHAGTRPNIVPDLATLEIDVRAVTADALAAARAEIQVIAATPAVADVTVEVEVMAEKAPMERLERSERLIEQTVALAGRLGFGTAPAATGGASDANTTAGLGIPTVDGLGPVGGHDHAPDEYLLVDSIVPRTTLLAALLLATGRDPVVGAWRAGR